LFIEDNQEIPRILSAFSNINERNVTLNPGQFLVQTYNLALPSDLTTVFSFTLAGFPGSTYTTLVNPPQTIPAQPATAVITTEKADRQPSIRDLQSLYRPYDANFSAHEPTYFVVGTDPAKSKFQLSFKYRLFNPSGSLSRSYPWISGFHLGYTQTSYWDLAADSLPFEDTSYKPELLYLSSNLEYRPRWLDAFFIQTAVQHESNGRGGDSSRSTNYVYTKPIFALYDKNTRLGIMFSPKFLYYFNNDDDTNPDLSDYRGYVDLEVKVGKAHSLMLTTNTRFAKKGTSFQADLSYPISRLLGNNFDIYLQLQYSNALAESLLHYQERTEALRLGIALVR
jgi:outer membrane phospholipase A